MKRIIAIFILITFVFLPWVCIQGEDSKKCETEETTTIQQEITLQPIAPPVVGKPKVEETEETTEKPTEEPATENSTPKLYEVFTLEEIYLIQRCVETECYTADVKSKTNVACVIFNRFKDRRFGSSITEIITKPNQFSYFRTEISNTTIQAVEEAWEQDITQGALYFHSSNYNGNFDRFATFLFKDDIGHHFYK